MKLMVCLMLGMFTWNMVFALVMRSSMLGTGRLRSVTSGKLLYLGSRRVAMTMSSQVALFSRPPLLAKQVKEAVQTSPIAVKLLDSMPSALKGFLGTVHPRELCLLLLFRAAYSPVLKFAHRMQNAISKATKFGEPSFWPNSVLAFVHERSQLLIKVMAFNYLARLASVLLTRLGFNLRPGLPDLLSRISYTLFFTHFVDRFKSQFLRVFFPQAAQSRRQSYLINKTTSVAVWTIGALAACEMISSFLKIPLSSTLAFGGIGGLTVGLSLKDMAANFMGGVMLLMNEPFTPGDMVTFLSGKTEVSGSVLRAVPECGVLFEVAVYLTNTVIRCVYLPQDTMTSFPSAVAPADHGPGGARGLGSDAHPGPGHAPHLRAELALRPGGRDQHRAHHPPEV